MTTQYIAELVRAFPRIREVWLYGSRANGTEKPDSDWDYLAFADDLTLNEIYLDSRFHSVDVDLMVVTDGVQFAKPWRDGSENQKTGTLSSDFGGLCWRKLSETEAEYVGNKWINDEMRVQVLPRKAKRVYP